MFGLHYTAEEEAFRTELRDWLAQHLPRAPPPEDEDARREYQRAWQGALASGGWVGVQWPRAHGGRGATLKQQIIFTEEMARARAPEILDAVAVNIVGSVLIHAATPAQQQRWLPRILPGDEVWCLGFSEPNAGSDLASLRCRADRDGDHWVINGQKVWSSKAHFADWLLLLVRTDQPAPAAQGHQLRRGRHACARGHVAAAGADQRAARVQRGLSRRRPRAGREHHRPNQRGWPLIRGALAHERGTLWAFDFKIRLQNGALALADLYRRLRDGERRTPRPLEPCATRWRRRTSSPRSSALTRSACCPSSMAATPVPMPRCRSSSAARSSSGRASCRCSWGPARAARHRRARRAGPRRLAGALPLLPLGDDLIGDVRGVAQPDRAAGAWLAAWLTSDAAKEGRHEGSAQGLARP